MYGTSCPPQEYNKGGRAFRSEDGGTKSRYTTSLGYPAVLDTGAETRHDLHAARAGTRGFRAPEVGCAVYRDPCFCYDHLRNAPLHLVQFGLLVLEDAATKRIRTADL